MTKALLHELGKSKSYGRLSLLAKVLWPMLLSTSDDQGRGDAEADTIKWYVCPNVPEIGVDDVPRLLAEMVEQKMLLLYECNGEPVYQVIHWWDYQQLRWARPSEWAPPDGWTDRIRYSNRGDMHDNEGWYTTGGFDAEPIESARSRSGKKVPPDDTEFCTENTTEVPQKTLETSNLTQPNLTQLNLTQPNLTPSGQRARPPPLERGTLTPDQIPKPDSALKAKWRDEILPDLRGQVAYSVYEKWFLPIEPLGVLDSKLLLGVSDQYEINWCATHHGPTLNRTCSTILGQSLAVTFVAMPPPGGT